MVGKSLTSGGMKGVVIGLVQTEHAHVNVGVDHAGRDHTPFNIDDLGIRFGVGCDLAHCANRQDTPALDGDGFMGGAGRVHVQHFGVGQDARRAAGERGRLGGGCIWHSGGDKGFRCDPAQPAVRQQRQAGAGGGYELPLRHFWEFILLIHWLFSCFGSQTVDRTRWRKPLRLEIIMIESV